ncbi:MAG: hypothetical protein LBK61_02385 [Spirochaetaceae bacterium]|nr:hypothetical protein [Spirochaetaceae bacterium]
MPLRGMKTRRVFIPLRNISPILAEESAAGRQNTPLWRTALPGAKTRRVFIPL